MKRRPVSFQEIRRLFGTAVATDLQERNVVVERTNDGGFVLPRGQEWMHQEYSKLMKKVKKNPKEKNRPPRDKRRATHRRRVLKYRPEDHDFNDDDNVDLFVDFRRTVGSSFKNADASSMVKKSKSSDVIMTEKKSILITKKQNEAEHDVDRYDVRLYYEDLIKSKLFRRDSNTINKFCEFMGPDRRKYELCLPLIEPIYEKFLIKHKRFRYEFIANSIPRDKSSMRGEISRRQLYEFFRKIFLVVVPVELFGNRRNVRKIRKMVNKYFETGFGEHFFPQSVVNQLNISSVEWLRVIEDEDTKISIISQLVESFFAKYIMGVLGTYFHSEKMLYSTEKLFFRWYYWKHVSGRYLSRLTRNRDYAKIEPQQQHERRILPTGIPDARLIPLLKKSGIRPILVTTPTPMQKREASILNRLLHQLLLKKFEILKPSKVESLWRSIHEACCVRGGPPVYFVSCDINNAFGSINLQKLVEIIFDMMDNLDEKVILQKFIIYSHKFDGASCIQREYFDTPSLPLALPTKSLACRDTTKPARIMDRDWLKNRLRDYILHRTIAINYRPYKQLRGVGQGVPLSSMLCQIYYGTMLLEELGSFTISGHLLRYVDDFLYISQDRASAERFLDQIRKGIPSYNCTFNAKKTSSNLPPYCADEFIYLGYCFNINNFSVTPQYPNLPIRYTTNLDWTKSRDSLMIFSKKIRNMECLKAGKLVLDPSINPKKVIQKTVQQIVTMAAKRCLTFLLSITDLENKAMRRVFHIIESSSVNPLSYKLLKILRPKTTTFKWRRKLYLESLKKRIWKIYFETFRRKAALFKPLVRLMKTHSK